MTRKTYCFEPLEDCCCAGTPRVLLRRTAGMAFNFSAAPEKAPLPAEPMHSQRNAPRPASQIFSRLNFFPAH